MIPEAPTISDSLAQAFEIPADGIPFDETSISVRAYVTRIAEDKLARYDASWSDQELMEWDGNFRDDGDLMLVCCERDVDAHEFRAVVEEFIEYRAEHAADQGAD